MSKIKDLKAGNLGEPARRQRREQHSTPLNGSSVGYGGMRYYGTGRLTVENEGLYVFGVANISGTLIGSGVNDFSGENNLSGINNLSGENHLTGPTDVAGNLEIIEGGLFKAGATEIRPDGSAKFGGLNIEPDGTLTSGLFELNPDGSAKFGLFDIAANGDLVSKGTLSIDGVTTLKADLNVAAGKKISLGSISLESGGASGGQINLVGGALTSSASLGTLLVAQELEIASLSTLKLSAGNVVNTQTLPTSPEPANLYIDPVTGVWYRSSAA